MLAVALLATPACQTSTRLHDSQSVTRPFEPTAWKTGKTHPSPLPPVPTVALVNALPETIIETKGDVLLGWTSPDKFTIRSDLADVVRALLPGVAKKARCPLATLASDRGGRDLTVVIDFARLIGSTIIKSLECQTFLALRVSCYDRYENLLATVEFTGTGLSNEPLPVAIVGAFA